MTTNTDVNVPIDDLRKVLTELRALGGFDAYSYLVTRVDLGQSHDDAFAFAQRIRLSSAPGEPEAEMDEPTLRHAVLTRGVTVAELFEIAEAVEEMSQEDRLDAHNSYLTYRNVGESHESAMKDFINTP